MKTIRIPPNKLTFDEIIALVDSIEAEFDVELHQVGPDFIKFTTEYQD